jgi:flagellar biosynthesis activator protein FlaF
MSRRKQPQPMQIRQNITDIGGFALKQTVAMQMDPAPAKPKPLIDTHLQPRSGPSARLRPQRPLHRYLPGRN